MNASSEMKQVSAQVLVDAASASAGEDTLRAFAQSGFQTGPLTQHGFSISGPAAHFEQYFGVKLESERGGFRVRGAPGYGDELPLENVPDSLRSRVQKIVFSRPLDFGPGAHF